MNLNRVLFIANEFDVSFELIFPLYQAATRVGVCGLMVKTIYRSTKKPAGFIGMRETGNGRRKPGLFRLQRPAPQCAYLLL